MYTHVYIRVFCVYLSFGVQLIPKVVTSEISPSLHRRFVKACAWSQGGSRTPKLVFKYAN